jgi:hypothetical protein
MQKGSGIRARYLVCDFQFLGGTQAAQSAFDLNDERVIEFYLTTVGPIHSLIP